jgi:hypothetical protein
MAKREYNGEPIDLTESYEWTANNDDAGKTVGGSSPDDNGTMKTDFWPSEAPPRRELNEDQIKVIEAAANPSQSFETLHDLAERVVPNKSSSYPSYVLRKKWPAGHEKIVGRPNEGGGDRGGAEVDDEGENAESADIESRIDQVRRRLLDGETTRGVAGDYECSKAKVLRVAKGDHTAGQNTTTAPLNWDEDRRKWVRAETPDDRQEPKSESTPDHDAERVTPTATGRDTDSRLKTAVAVLVAFVLGWVIGR